MLGLTIVAQFQIELKIVISYGSLPLLPVSMLIALWHSGPTLRMAAFLCMNLEHEIAYYRYYSSLV